MNQAQELRKLIETCELPHLAYKELLDNLSLCLQDARDGFAPRIEWLVGPSRVGKSMLINALARPYPRTQTNGRWHVPVLVVPFKSAISPTHLPINVLTALGSTVQPKGINAGTMFDFMVKQLKLAHTWGILFEEASHLVEVGARVPPRAAADWFKSLADELNATMIFSGVPRLEQLFASNEQLRLRSAAKSEFRPYDSRDAMEKEAFASCVRTYADMFRKFGWPIDLTFTELVTQCYLLSGGLVGVLSHFMRELATQRRSDVPRSLTKDDCRNAVARIQVAGHPDYPAFMKSSAAPIELAAAHARVLEDNGMSMRIALPA